MRHANKLERQRKYRERTNNACTKKYEKTVKGFLMRLYRNMQSRITGVQKVKAGLYVGKDLLSRDEFYTFSTGSSTFYQLFGAYRESGFERKLAPSVDRVDSSKGYTIENMEWVTMSENSRRGAAARHRK